ncbi:FRG domain-containing protein [Aeromonas caviae]|uniref:FRG domain-containing protein n=1 Tax=Aeromonas caviae TaxID=648 RepID=UPI0038D09F25
MNSQRISSFSEFISSIENLSNGAELMLFRGQARKGNLLPSVAREKPHLDSTNDEKNLLQELRRMGSSILPRNDMDDWELMVVAQHFGMKTREGANKQVISSQADSLIKISRIWADFFPANTSNQPI